MDCNRPWGHSAGGPVCSFGSSVEKGPSLAEIDDGLVRVLLGAATGDRGGRTDPLKPRCHAVWWGWHA